jgi:hypothetical protein
VDRNEFEARARRALGEATTDFQRRLWAERLTYPKRSGDAETEVRARGYDLGGDRVKRWLRFQDEIGEFAVAGNRMDEAEGHAGSMKPPRMAGVRGNTLAWEKHHIDALCAYLEKIDALTDHERALRRFAVTQTQVDEAALEAMQTSDAHVLNIFYWNGSLTAIPADVAAKVPARPLGAFVCQVHVGRIGEPSWTPEMANLFRKGRRAFCEPRKCFRHPECNSETGECPDRDGKLCPISDAYLAKTPTAKPTKTTPARKIAAKKPARKGKK